MNTPTRPDPAVVQHLFQLISGYIVSAALGAVARLGVADQLAAGPKTTADLARAVGANEDALFRALRALAMAGVFVETAPRTFALTPVGDLLRADAPFSARDMAVFLPDDFHFRLYAEMLHAVTTGEAVGEKVVGMPLFEYLRKNPDLSARFNAAMTNFSASVAPAALAAYDFDGIGVLVDVAGGHGMLLGSVLQRYPAMRGILFDVEHVLAGAGPTLEALGVRNRVETKSGDFFTGVPAGGDAYMMKHIIHDWDDERSGAILRHIRTALEEKPNGRLILLESVVKPGNEPDLSKLIDLEMLLLPGGRERTEAEFGALFSAHGFELTRVVPTESPLSVIEKRKRDWADELKDSQEDNGTPIHPARLLKEIAGAAPRDAIYVTDVGWNKNGAGQQLVAATPRSFITSGGMATMGFSPAAAIGAKLGAPENTVICLVGDGGLMSVVGALTTAVELNVPVVWVLFNNFCFSTIRSVGSTYFNNTYGTEFTRPDGTPYNPDFMLLAKSFGIDSSLVEQPADLREALCKAFRANVPYLVEVRTRADVPMPRTGHWDIADFLRLGND